jgi:signal transduction histidine kinase
VVLATPAPRRPSEQHLELMNAFTNQAGVAFQNAKLYQASRIEQDRMIQDENELRQKLARELHDGPTQKVAALVMQLEYINRLLDENVPEAKKELTKAHNIAQQTVKEIRTALFTLRPLALETKGLSAALAQYGERMREVEKINIQVEPGEFGTELNLNIASTVFSIVDEAVTNARKHAARSEITVRAYQQENSLVATIQDQGPGFDLMRVLNSYDKKASLGLQNMRDRAGLVDGDLRIETQPGRGTRIMLIVPLIPKDTVGSTP